MIRKRLKIWGSSSARLLTAAMLLSLPLRAADLIRWTPPSTNGLRDLAEFLRPLQKELDLPALAAAVVHDHQITAAGTVGERKFGSGVPLALSDPLHIGSCTKSMTGLLAVDLARAGHIRLDTPVGEIFPDWNLPAEKAGITLDLLLQNRSGLSGQPDAALWARAFEPGTRSARMQREDFLREALPQPLEAPPGTKEIYSNTGFSLAGAMLERKENKAWEELMRERIFQPLGLRTAGFGPPSHEDKIDAPWGHRRLEGKIVPVPAEDNPAAIAPAGLVHLSILDLARYAAFHLDNFNQKIPELKAWRERMYTPPPGSDYAYGWIVQTRGWAGGPALTHAGSNTMFYAVIWLAPAKDYAFVVITNIGDKESGEDSTAGRIDRVVAGLITRFLP